MRLGLVDPAVAGLSELNQARLGRPESARTIERVQMGQIVDVQPLATRLLDPIGVESGRVVYEQPVTVSHRCR